VSSALPAVKDALMTVAATLWPTPAAVYYGPTGANLPELVINIGNARTTDITRPTMGGSRASRDETFEVDVLISVYEPGDWTVQRTATVKAFAAMAQLDDYLRTWGTNQTLGGVCREAWVSGWDLAESISDSSNGEVLGRVSDLTTTVTVSTRI